MSAICYWDHSRGSLPTDTFGTNLLIHNDRVGFINSDTAVFCWPTIAVNTHIFRVANRTELAMGKNEVGVEQKLLKVVPLSSRLIFITG
jgi:hypothetical protein